VTIKDSTYDLVVLGGGITGAGIVRDATLRGLRAALFEKSDFGSGTSSKSSKMIHGGLRYLGQGKIGLVFESVSERRVQSKVAPHLVRAHRFFVPIYKDSKPGLEIVNIGLWIYDFLALFRSPMFHKTYRGKKAAGLVPQLKSEGLTGALEYADCVTDDSRLVLENIIDSRDKGARCENYTKVISLLRKDNGRVHGVEIENLLTGKKEKVFTRSLIIAAGAWTDQVAKETKLAIGHNLLRRTKGVHAVFPLEVLPIKRACTVISPEDGRVMFVIPWRDRMVVGTTDTDFEGSSDAVHADTEDVQYLCNSANKYFPEANFSPDKVIATWSGLRPLIDENSAANESAVSREHEIYVRDDGVTIIAGGKLTTYRLMAKEAVLKTLKWLTKNDPDFSKEKIKRVKTKKFPLPGARGLKKPKLSAVMELATELKKEFKVDEEVARHLCTTYGTRVTKVLEPAKEDSTLLQRINNDLPFIWAEVGFAANGDLAKTVDDVLSRRIPLLLLGRKQGLDVAEKVASILATVHKWNDQQTKKHIADYHETVANSREFSTKST